MSLQTRRAKSSVFRFPKLRRRSKRLWLTIETHALGLGLCQRYQLSVYDAMIVAAAQLGGCTTLYSEDMHHGLVIDGLTITDPFR